MSWPKAVGNKAAKFWGGPITFCYGALYFKKPVIATNAGGTSEVVDNMKDGIICEPNSENLMNVLKKYLNNRSDYKEMGLNGYNKLVQSFSMDKMTRNLEKYLMDFID